MKDIGLGWRIRVKIDSYLEKLEMIWEDTN
jgi:hypothetical protein